MADPYLIEGPALISFSGGRTSAYMLWHILQAHGGTLPADVHVTFANTGKEREETLRFVHECEARWGVPIVWIEYAETGSEKVSGRWRKVDFSSASRSGEPFEALIARRGMAPNGVSRFCSPQLKFRPIEYWAKAELGWTEWTCAVGLRHDEGHRCLKMYERNLTSKDCYKARLPLDKAKVTERDVLAFWHGPTMDRGRGERPAGFDLELYSYEGNCDLCFLKRRSKLLALMRENPGMSDWWIRQERACAPVVRDPRAALFRDESYAAIQRQADTQQTLNFDRDGDEHDVECSLLCVPDQEAA